MRRRLKRTKTKEDDPKDRSLPWACFICRRPAQYQVSKMLQEILGYHEDEDGNLQMNLKNKEEFIWVCKEHLKKYLFKDYKIRYSKNIFEQLALERLGVIDE